MTRRTVRRPGRDTAPHVAATAARLPPGPFGRVLWLASADPPSGWAQQWAADPSAAGPFDAVVLDDLGRPGVLGGPVSGRVRLGSECEALQRRLRPGGLLALLDPARPRARARQLRHWFEGGTPTGRERYRPVRARGGAVLAYRRGPALALGHFDELAEDYVAEIPPHLVGHYLGRKLELLRAALGTSPGGTESSGRLGLDLGCGVGEYARAVAAGLGARIVAVDASQPAVAVARRRGDGGGDVSFAAADAQRLPFGDASFDFAYTINMVHHLKRGEQSAALAEALRVLKPGAPLVVFEINVRNPLFRLYMRHVFPRTRRIDRGDEEFLTPRRLADALPEGATLERVAYSTFVPDFTPRWLLPVLRPVERGLEAVAGPLAIHYAAVLRRA